MQTERTTVRQLAERGRYEREQVESILDEAPFCHVGFTAAHGPMVLPTIHARDGATLYLHGSPASAMLGAIESAPLCVTATILDGFVLARSAFHHSMNYRSVVVFGAARRVDDPDEKVRALRAVVEHVVPGRWDELRAPTAKEIAGTRVLALPLDEASAKVRGGGPVDDPADVSPDVWAGVLPVEVTARALEPDASVAAGLDVPASILRRAASIS